MAGKKFSIEAIFSAIDKISAPVAKIKTKLSGLGKGAGAALKGANTIVDKGIAGMGKFSAAAGVAGAVSVAGLTAAMADTISTGADFERTLTFAAAQFPGMIRYGTKEFDELERAARRVGDTTETSSEQAAEGLTLLATAGLSAKAAIAALPKVVNFATAAKVDFSRAADIANNSLSIFAMNSEDATKNAQNMGRVMDVLVRAAADSTTNVEELFDALKTGGGVAHTAGISLEAFTGYVEVLANKGIKGSEAGTAIRQMFLELGAPTTSAVKGMAALGVRLAKTKTGAIDMTATIARFSKATSKMTAAQKIAALGNVFGARTLSPFINLMDAGTDKLNEYKKSLEVATGTTDSMAVVLQSDATGAFKHFEQMIAGLKLDVFKAIRPTVLEIVGAVTTWIGANRELIKTQAVEWLGKLRDNLPVIWDWTVKLGKAFLGFLAFAATVKAITFAVEAYTLATKLAVPITWAWNAAANANIASNLALAGEVVALKVAQLASALATGAVTAATWLYNAALAVGELGNRRFTLSAIASKLAQLASSVATAAVTAAMWLYNAALVAVDLVTGRLTISTIAAKVAQLASQAATWLANAAQTAYAVVVAASSGALGVFTAAAWSSVTAIGAQATALAPFLITVGAVTAAVLALYAAWNQWQKLNASLSGSGGIIGTIAEMTETGTWDPFKAHDAVMDRKARLDRKMRDEQPQVVSPQARAASEAAEASASANVSGEITVRPAPGTTATATGKRSKVPLRVQPSGAF